MLNAPALVLIACQPSEMEVLRGLVPPKASVVMATSIGDATERIAKGVDAVICSMKFDDSRMLELVRETHLERPEVPVLCCRVFASRISDLCVPAAATAALSMGAGTFIDLADLAATLLRLLG